MRSNRIPASFLPDFCGSRTLFVLVLVAELLAISLALARPGSTGDRLQTLGLFSLLVQSVAVISAGALCLLQPRIRDLSEHWVAVCSYATTLFISLCVSELAWRLGSDWMSLPDEPALEHLPFLARSLGVSAISWALTLRYFYVQHQWRRHIESEADARFQALQSRIRPHFLFNCMNTIAGLTRRSPPLAEEAIEDLADLIRASLRDVRRPGTLREELELCERYLRIEGHRLGERLRVDWVMCGIDCDISLPALILQPLLENAIYHGIEPLTGGGTIRIESEVRANALAITITNPRPVHAQDGGEQPGNRLAQENIRQRLAAYFRQDGLLNISEAPQEYRVTLTIPLQHENPDR